MTRNRIALLCALGIDNFGSGLFLPLSLVYATRVIGLSLSVAGTVVAVGTVAGLLIPPVAGRFVDRVGPRPVVIVAQLVQAGGTFCYLVADGIAGTLFAAVLLAAGQQMFYSALFSLIADVTDHGPKDKAFALVNMVRSATFGLGALTAGVFIAQATQLGLKFAVAADAASFVVCAGLLAVLVRVPHTTGAAVRAHGDTRRLLHDKPFLALIVAAGLVALVGDFFLVGMPVFALDVVGTAAWVPGAMMAVLTVLSSVAATVVVHRTRMLRRTTTMAIGAGVYVVWCGLVVATPLLPRDWTAAWLLGTTALLALGGLLFGARANALSEAAAPRAHRGRYLAGFQYAFTVPGVLAPGLVALFATGAALPWLVVAGAAGLGGLALLALARRLPAHAVAPEASGEPSGVATYCVPMPSLTLAEAQARADLLSVDHYTIDLDLTRGEEVFSSTTTVEFGCARPGALSWIDVAPQTLRRVLLNGEPVDVSDLSDGRLPLGGLQGRNTVVVEADMAYSHDGEGLHRSVDPADDRVYLYAMSFLDAAPRIFACFDQPDLKATFDVTVTARPDWIVLGNGRADQEQPGRWRLATTQPLSTYLVTLVAGPYHSVLAEHDGIGLGLHVKQSLAVHLDEQADELITLTRQCFDEFHRLFGIRYPFGDYHQAFVPEFNAGAMENPGCVTFRDPLIFRGRPTDAERSTRANTIAHEMAHQWFGNLVTMQWWDDLWLNESFAEYMGYRVCDAVTDFRDGWVDSAYVRNHWGMRADNRSTTHPVAAREAVDAATALNNFDGISYAKGASVLKQLSVHMGDAAFIEGVVRHLREHAFGNAAFADLVRSWSASGAQRLDTWSQQWLRTSGADTITVSRDDGTVTLRREAPDDESPRRDHTFWLAGVGTNRVEQTLVTLTDDSTSVTVDVDGLQLVVPDSHDDTWAKFRLDPVSLVNLPATLPTVTDPVARGAVWNSLRFAVDDGVLDPAVVLDLLEQTLPGEPEEIAVGNLLRWAGQHLSRRLLPDPRTARRVSDLGAAALRGAPPGSSRQLVTARAVAAASVETDWLQGWLDGSAVPDGLVVDADLRWTVLLRLAVLGAVDEGMVDTELAGDRSAQGVVHAARCRAALPSPTAKSRAWELLTTDPAVSNYVLYATAEGFWWPSQDHLTAAYVPRYFAEMPRTSTIRHGWVVSRSIELAYPDHRVDSSTVQLAETALTADDLEPGVRRALVDGTDDLRRALHVRRAWGHEAG